MTVLERKNHLHQLVVETNDTTIDWWDNISGAEKNAIETGKADLEAGRTVLHEDVRKKALVMLK